MNKAITVLALAAMLTSCRTEVPKYGTSFIYPDYVGVTVPSSIAALNFDYTVASDGAETSFKAGDASFTFKGTKVRWRARDWRELTGKAAGGDGTISVHSSSPDSTWNIYVSRDEIDYGLTYRKIEPGYEVYSRMGIYQRELGSFKERALLENTGFSGCVNCHTGNRGSADEYSLHIRGNHGATLLKTRASRNAGDTALTGFEACDAATLEAYDTKTDSTLGLCVYPYWHPSGSYIAYSTNQTRQLFHLQPDKLIEVFDQASDIQVYDIAGNTLVSPPQLKTDEFWDTFPVFSADGSEVYFCRAVARETPDSLSEVRYNLCKIAFDAATGQFGDEITTVIDAESARKSIAFPRPSYDGRYIMYTCADYGQFPIWHHEADLWLYDIASGETKAVDNANSADTESFHNWSLNSRWFVFSSRRDDGLFTRLYIAHIDGNGQVDKPFMLPQRNPSRYYGSLFMSYNVPEFATAPVEMDKRATRRLINSDKRVKMGFSR